MSTQSQGPAIFKHIIETVFGEPMDGELVKALHHFGISNHLSLMTMSDASIERLEYPDDSDNKNKIQLHDGHKQLIRIFQDYVTHYDVEPSDIIKITSDPFDYFRIKIYSPNTPINRNTTSSSSPSPSYSRSSAYDFRKSVKRDKTQYTMLKTDKQWDAWKRSTVATARAHGCKDIFDGSYRPKAGDETDIFVEKQKFMYSVFEEMLQTDMGKYFVRLHEADFDAQAVFKKLSTYAKESTQASIDTADLLSYITSVKLHTLNWKGSTTSFILHWCDKI